MFKKIAQAVGGDPQKKELERLSALAKSIDHLEPSFESLSDDDLQNKSNEFRKRLNDGESLDDILPEAFAAVREASKRTLGQRHFDVQMIGGIVMHEGNIAEMRTGEGKTLAATLPLYLNALSGKGGHLVTVNDYLARRDARWMAPIYHSLGMSVGVLQMASQTDHGRNAYIVDFTVTSNREDQHHLRLVPRREAYAADITYGTNNEFGFDYLRDNLVQRIEDRVQRGHYYAIIDEVDNILIDEARTPLIISGQASEDVALYEQTAQVVKQLNPEDYDFSEKDRSIALTEIGEVHVEELLKMPLRDPERPEDITPEQARILGYLEQALRAELLFKKNKDYIKQNSQVIIVDEFTGRLMPGRRWSEGLHQAVEAKEGVKVNPENITHATITLQNYFRMYEKLAGMTGTALTEAEEFSTIYQLGVLPIPTNLDYIALQPDSHLETDNDKDDEGYTYTYYARVDDPNRKAIFWKRKDYPDIVYRTLEVKLRAITLEIIRYHVIGRPQLVGTTSIEHSQQLSARLNTETIRRLLQIVLITHNWRKLHQIKSEEQAIPELAFLNEPLSQIKPADLRKISQQAGLDSLNIESDSNISTLLETLRLDASGKERIKKVFAGGIPHQVLNALKHDVESQIIAEAGAFGSVTIATNMAGRGVDIKLGGELEEHVLADITSVLQSNGIEPFDFSYRQLINALSSLQPEKFGAHQESVNTFMTYIENMRKVREVGGLHVIGSERHDARRIDDQLRGRSARQGDPGSSRFYLSLEDDLMRLFGGERAEAMMRFFNIDVSLPIESKLIGKMVEQAQQRVEGYNFDVRKHLLEYDDVLNEQRKRIYAERDKVLSKADLNEDIQEMLASELSERIQDALQDPQGSWKLLAYLDEIQPSMFYPQYKISIPSFTLKLIADQAFDTFGKKEVEIRKIKETYTEIAKQATRAEQEHLENSVREFIERTALTFQDQLTERLENVEIFLDGIRAGNTENIDRNQFIEDLNSYTRLSIKISREEISLLFAGEKNATEKLKSQITYDLKQIFLRRINFTLERRIGEKILLDIENLSSFSWQEISEKYILYIADLFNHKINDIDAGSGQIARNIEAILKQDRNENFQLDNFLMGLALLATGSKIAINTRTHQRGLQRISLLNYAFLAAEYLSKKSVDQISQDVQQHFEKMRSLQARAWGIMDFERVKGDGKSLADLNQEIKRGLLEKIRGGQFENISEISFEKLDNEQQEIIIQELGGHLQNAIYRHILINAVTELWSEHLTRMEALRVSIRMEAYAQRDPLVQYKSESSDAFKRLLADIRMTVISRIFRVQPAQRKPEMEKPALPEIQATTQPNQSKQPLKKKKRKRHKKR